MEQGGDAPPAALISPGVPAAGRDRAGRSAGFPRCGDTPGKWLFMWLWQSLATQHVDEAGESGVTLAVGRGVWRLETHSQPVPHPGEGQETGTEGIPGTEGCGTLCPLTVLLFPLCGTQVWDPSPHLLMGTLLPFKVKGSDQVRGSLSWIWTVI